MAASHPVIFSHALEAAFQNGIEATGALVAHSYIPVHAFVVIACGGTPGSAGYQ